MDRIRVSGTLGIVNERREKREGIIREVRVEVIEESGKKYLAVCRGRQVAKIIGVVVREGRMEKADVMSGEEERKIFDRFNGARVVVYRKVSVQEEISVRERLNNKEFETIMKKQLG